MRGIGENYNIIVSLVPSSDVRGNIWKIFIIFGIVINKDFKESPSTRNMNTSKDLAEDCK